ncbi:MAG: ATP-grasp domain-containing protein [Tissierellia bacterium]|nr:ATP-grasp domain-containing protein [Tissierellia bacterium]
MGLYVGVADYNPQAIGIPYADEYFNVSTIDEEGVYEAAKSFGADGIMTIATDMPMRSVAYACEKLGLIGISYDTAVKVTDKGEMIKAFKANGVAHPWFHIIETPDDLNTIAASVTFPCITKPTDNSGSRGVMLVSDQNQLQEAVVYSSKKARKGAVIIEEYMYGPEVSVEVMVLNGEPHILQVTDKLTTGAPNFVEMGHSQPSQLADDELSAIGTLASQAVLAVGIQNGPAHVEIILTEQGPKMVELGARMGGDCITTHLVPLSTGIDMVKASIQVALGKTPDISPKFSKGAAIRYFNVQQGYISDITGIEDAQNIKGVQEITFLKRVGDRVDSINSSMDRIGFVIAQGSDANSAIIKCEESMKRICIKYD